MSTSGQCIQLQPATLQAFEDYVLSVEREFDVVEAPGAFLWSDAEESRTRALCGGSVVVEAGAKANQKENMRVPEGLIHDWIGAGLVPNRTVQQALEVVQDYDHHNETYKPEVLDSHIVSRTGDDFQVYLRLRKKKIITVVLDTYHNAHYSRLGPHRAVCRSRSTQIREVQDPGTTREAILLADTGHGFLWRLYTYWRFEEKNGGVVVECRAISLTRDVPAALAWIINPIVRKLPKESLSNTLAATRDALVAH